jgi:hypothetical protein
MHVLSIEDEYALVRTHKYFIKFIEVGLDLLYVASYLLVVVLLPGFDFDEM